MKPTIKAFIFVSLFILFCSHLYSNTPNIKNNNDHNFFAKTDTTLNSRIYSFYITENSISVTQTSEPENSDRIILSRNIVKISKAGEHNLYIYLDYESGRREEISFYKGEDNARDAVYDAIVRIWRLR